MSLSFRRALMGFCSASLVLPNFTFAAPAINTAPSADVAPYVVAAAHEPHLSAAQMTSLIRHHIKYVFVIYQENRSFDSYFGTYPGADGLYSQPASATAGFTQPITNVDGSTGTIQPFLIGPAQYAADTDDIDHSHPLTTAKMDVVNGAALMDHFAL
ncbi:MAG TPA: alkaline phosphatase family protein, partial [Acidocella sp.]|nr:alkaline phosphatase family protein [Acidocella sp.]